MITASNNVNSAIISPVRYIKARVELYNSSALLDTFNSSDKLIDFTIERAGANKIFGFGVFQKIVVKILDRDRELNITDENTLKVIYEIEGEDVAPYPFFFVNEVIRDENNNNLTITAYDALNAASAHKSAELALYDTPEEDGEAAVIDDIEEINILSYIKSCINVLSIEEAPVILSLGEWENIIYTDTKDVNLEGTETIRDVLDAIAEITHSIYYIDKDNKLTFKQLNHIDNGALMIDKSQYVTLQSAEIRKLGAITHATELGDNITVNTAEDGVTQYLRDNPFIELNVNNVTLILNDIVEQVGGITINQFSCEWKGNPLVEIGDKLTLLTKDNQEMYSYLLNDTVTYNGALKEVTNWEFADNEEETEDNPSSLGDALKQTFAKVDKVNKLITILASKTDDNEEALAELKITTDGITASVANAQKAVSDLSDNYNTIYNLVEAKITASDVDLKITEALESGVNSVSTTTGFTFNSDGLNISKSDSEISTLINEDGMRVSKNNTEVLTANNTGVNAINLTANQYLIIGDFSRFENYGSNRTGCFWIGG